MRKSFAVECINLIDNYEHQSPILIGDRNVMGAFGNLTRASGRKLKVDRVGRQTLGDHNTRRGNKGI